MTRYASWLVPAVAVALVGGGVAASAAAPATPDLPARTPAELLAAVATADPRSLSGTITTEADLGLPRLPAMGGANLPSDPQALLTRLLAGESTVRVWVDGPDRFKAALVDDSAELQVVADGTEVWTYSATENLATRYPLPADQSGGDSEGSGGMSLESFTPDGVATQALAAIGPDTEVTVGGPQFVADRAAYTLVVAPRTAQTLVDRIEIAVDAESSLLVQVQVFARGQQDPAYSAGFTSLDLEVPDAAVFDFTPPAGAEVVEGGSHMDGDMGGMPGATAGPGMPDFAIPSITGSGWATVLELPAPADDLAMLDQLTERVDGGRAVSTALLSILLTADGRVLVGAVPVDTLVEAAR